MSPHTSISDDDRDGESLAEPLLPTEQSDTSPERRSERASAASGSSPEGNGFEHSHEEVLTIDESSWDHGEVQPPAFRDPLWAVLFLLQVAIVLGLSLMAIISLSKEPLPEHHHHPEWDWNTTQVLLMVLMIIGGVAILSSVLILLLLTALADMMIQVSLVVSPISCGLSAFTALCIGQIGPALLLMILSLLGVCYAVSVWHRIPFATANLAVAMAAIHVHKGLLTVAYATLVQASIWSIIWICAVFQVTVIKEEWIYDGTNCGSGDDTSDGDDTSCHENLSSQGKFILLGLLLSFYWTSQVIRNVLHTTIAGVVGTFWFTPQESTESLSSSSSPCGCSWNSCIFDSWVRSSLYSFGSVCFGSLLVALLQVIRLLVRLGRSRRENRDQRSSLLWCVLEFTVEQLERLLEYINSWGFVYVGLYGYDYWTSGHKVYQLFMARGWSLILNDHLISRSLRMMKLFIGLLSGILTVILVLVSGGSSEIHPFGSFVAGMLLGFFFADIQLGVVTSAVETIFVCFAESPTSLVMNHPPELADRMIGAWRAAYPTECGI